MGSYILAYKIYQYIIKNAKLYLVNVIPTRLGKRHVNRNEYWTDRETISYIEL